MRTETTTRTLYKFSELSEPAKQKATEAHRQFVFETWDPEYIIEDFIRLAAILGAEVSKVYYSGFSSQGDGASFEGTYTYSRNAPALLRKETGDSEPELIRIATELQKLQRKNFYRLEAKLTTHGNYCNSSYMDAEVWDRADQYRDVPEREVQTLLRDLADWLYKRLEEEYDYQTTDESVVESIEANDYEFTESGRLA